MAALRGKIEAVSHVICNARTLDWIQISLQPSDPEIIRTFDNIRKTWVKGIEPTIQETCGNLSTTVVGWLDQRSDLADLCLLPGGNEMKAEYLSLISLPLAQTVNEINAIKSEYDRHLFQIDFLLHGIGLIAARPQKWSSYLRDGASNVAMTGVPLLATIIAPMAVITLSIFKATSKAKSVAISDTLTKPAIIAKKRFFAFVQSLYAKTAHRLPPLIINKIADVDRTISGLIDSDDAGAWVALLRRRQGILLAGGRFICGSNTQIPVIPLCGTPEDGGVDLRVAQLLRKYPDLPQLGHLLTIIRENSIAKHPCRLQIQLEGGPGTGKTRCANKIALALGLPIFHVRIGTVADFQRLCTLEDVNQSSEYAFAAKENSDELLMTSIPYATTKTGCANVILFIDEAACLLPGSLGGAISPESAIDSLKILFDDNERYISANAVASGAMFDYSRMTIIMATTQSMRAARVDPALANRFWSFHSDPLSPQVKNVPFLTSLTLTPRYAWVWPRMTKPAGFAAHSSQSLCRSASDEDILGFGHCNAR